MLLLTAIFAILAVSAHASPLLKDQAAEKVLVNRVSTHYDRFRRSDGCEFHPFLRFNFNVNGVEIELNLEKNTHIRSNVPVYVVGDDRKAVASEINDQEKYALYQDVNRGRSSAMLASCAEDGSYKLEGSFRYEGIVYRMSPSNEPVATPAAANMHSVQRDHKQRIEYGNDSIKPPTSGVSNGAGNSTNREKRDIPTGNVVEILFVVDDVTLKYHEDIEGGTDAAKEALRRQISMLANEMDIYYAGLPLVDPSVDIRIYVTAVVVESSTDSGWSVDSRTTIDGTDYLDPNLILENIRTWESATADLPAHDHLMTMSLIEFAFLSGGVVVSTGLSGVAFSGVVCSNPSYSVSFTQLEFNGRTAQTMAHELGHALSAEHDENGNSCLESSNNVMTPVFSTTTTLTYAEAQWTFSSCSVDYFKTHLSGLGSGHCMLTHDFDDAAYSGYKGYGWPGDFYSIDEQCKMYEDSDSFACGVTDNSIDEADCYGGMHCAVGGSCSGSYFPLYPMTGTKCGTAAADKICHKGQCVDRTVVVTTTTTTASSTTSTTPATTTSTSTTPATTTSTSTVSTTSTTPATTTSTSTVSTTTPATTTSTSTTPSTTSTTESTTTTSTSPSTTTTTTNAPTTAAPCWKKKKCCVTIKVKGKKKKRCCKSKKCCKKNFVSWSADTDCYKSCCNTPPPPPPPPAKCNNKKKCCVGNRCCKGKKCCKFSWAEETECYNRCC